MFQAQGPIDQLGQIIDLVGTPTLEEMGGTCEGAIRHVLKRPPRQPNIAKLYSLTNSSNHEAIPLLQSMLKFDRVIFDLILFLFIFRINV